MNSDWAQSWLSKDLCAWVISRKMKCKLSTIPEPDWFDYFPPPLQIGPLLETAFNQVSISSRFFLIWQLSAKEEAWVKLLLGCVLAGVAQPLVLQRNQCGQKQCLEELCCDRDVQSLSKAIPGGSGGWRGPVAVFQWVSWTSTSDSVGRSPLWPPHCPWHSSSSRVADRGGSFAIIFFHVCT